MEEDRPTTEEGSVQRQDVERLRDLVKGIRVAMMVTIDAQGKLRSRPMATLEVTDEGVLWFLTSGSSGKVHELEHDRRVHLTYARPGMDRYVAVTGAAEVVDDRPKIRTLWNPLWRAWYPKGPEDPELTLVKVTVQEAEYWDTPGRPVLAAMGALRAFVGGKGSEIEGEHNRIVLRPFGKGGNVTDAGGASAKAGGADVTGKGRGADVTGKGGGTDVTSNTGGKSAERPGAYAQAKVPAAKSGVADKRSTAQAPQRQEGTKTAGKHPTENITAKGVARGTTGTTKMTGAEKTGTTGAAEGKVAARATVAASSGGKNVATAAGAGAGGGKTGSRRGPSTLYDDKGPNKGGPVTGDVTGRDDLKRDRSRKQTGTGTVQEPAEEGGTVAERVMHSGRGPAVSKSNKMRAPTGRGEPEKEVMSLTAVAPQSEVDRKGLGPPPVVPDLPEIPPPVTGRRAEKPAFKNQKARMK